jgi:hypothetical protein
MKNPCHALVISLAVLGIAACQKIEAPANQSARGTPLDFSGVTNAIPLDKGRLVAVTPLDTRPIDILWFERPDQTITGVRVNVSTGVIWDTAITVPRK